VQKLCLVGANDPQNTSAIFPGVNVSEIAGYRILYWSQGGENGHTQMKYIYCMHIKIQRKSVAIIFQHRPFQCIGQKSAHNIFHGCKSFKFFILNDILQKIFIKINFNG